MNIRVSHKHRHRRGSFTTRRERRPVRCPSECGMSSIIPPSQVESSEWGPPSRSLQTHRDCGRSLSSQRSKSTQNAARLHKEELPGGLSCFWLEAQLVKQLVKLHPVKRLILLLPGLGSKEQLPEVRADSTQHSRVRPPEFLPRVAGVKSHIGELHTTLQQPLHVLGEARLLHSNRRKTSWTEGGRRGTQGSKERVKMSWVNKNVLRKFSGNGLLCWKPPRSVVIYSFAVLIFAHATLSASTNDFSLFWEWILTTRRETVCSQVCGESDVDRNSVMRPFSHKERAETDQGHVILCAVTRVGIKAPRYVCLSLKKWKSRCFCWGEQI